jgi:hypothetical protein
MTPKTTPAQRKALREVDYRIVKAESITKVVTTLVRYGTFSFVAWTVLQMVQALAGHVTIADISLAVRFLVSEKKKEVFSWGVGAAGFFYGWRQRKFRKDDIERRSERIAELERRLDPRRSSSKLDKRGGTNPEDMR